MFHKVKVGKNRRITLPEGLFVEGDILMIQQNFADKHSFTLRKQQNIVYVKYLPSATNRTLGAAITRDGLFLCYVTSLGPSNHNQPKDINLRKDIQQLDKIKVDKIRKALIDNGRSKNFDLYYVQVTENMPTFESEITYQTEFHKKDRKWQK